MSETRRLFTNIETQRPMSFKIDDGRQRRKSIRSIPVALFLQSLPHGETLCSAAACYRITNGGGEVIEMDSSIASDYFLLHLGPKDTRAKTEEQAQALHLNPDAHFLSIRKIAFSSLSMPSRLIDPLSEFIKEAIRSNSVDVARFTLTGIDTSQFGLGLSTAPSISLPPTSLS